MKNKKKQRKQKKLKSLILLLFITIIMFATSTYAWFTANQTVTISSLDVHVEASNGLQISTDGITWKTVITNADITDNAYSGNVNMVPKKLNAVSSSFQRILTSENASDYGYLKMYKGLVSSNQTTGNYEITSTLSPEAKGTTGDFIAFDIFLKVEQNETVYLSKNATVAHKDTMSTGENPQVINNEDKGLRETARVAFVHQGHAASTAAAADITGAKDLVDDNIVQVWEPNANIHTASAVTIASEYGVTGPDNNSALVNGDVINYYGLNNTFANQDLKNTVKGVTNTNTTLINNTIKTIGNPTAQNPRTNVELMTLQPGITKIRVYMWIEGQDIDCENNASGTDISYNVILTIEET